jgi:hypothetical protein
MTRALRQQDRGTAYGSALLGFDRAGAGRAADAQKMAAFCEDVLPHHAPGLGPRLVWEGAQARNMTTADLEDLTRRKRWREFDVLMFDPPPRKARQRRVIDSFLTADRGNELEAAQAACELQQEEQEELCAVRVRFRGRRGWLWLGNGDYVTRKQNAQPGTRQACDQAAALLAARDPGARTEVVPL